MFLICESLISHEFFFSSFFRKDSISCEVSSLFHVTSFFICLEYDLIGGIVKKDEFKEFVKKHPKLVEYVNYVI